MARIDTQLLHSQRTIIGVLQLHAAQRPDALAYRFIETPQDGQGPSINYKDLDLKARQIATYVRQVAAQGDRVLLFFPPGLDYIATLLGCLYAGVVAVPLYPPSRGEKLTRIERVIRDCGARCALGLERDIAKTGNWLLQEMQGVLPSQFQFLQVEPADGCAPMDPQAHRCSPSDIAFLQYTSGSTGDPKGVMVSHGNLMANQAAIAAGFESRSDDVSLNWLPLYHDMGLIGTTLHPLYCGFPSYVMSPIAFIKDPLAWLECISRYRATVAGGPDFSYALCAKAALASPERVALLDLSSWRVAFNGAEPIRVRSMAGFAKAFHAAGFDRAAFYPCYGLAEATLFVSGANPGQGVKSWQFDKAALAGGTLTRAEGASGVELVSCGQCISAHELHIVADGCEVADGVVGEIWVSGPSVSSGYWGRGEANDDLFRARINDGPAASKCFLRTGDLGCRYQGELIITGRMKDVLILNGRNHYPQDIELAASCSHPALRHGCTAAFCVDESERTRVVVVQEVDPKHLKTLDAQAVANAVRAGVAKVAEISVDEVVLIQPASIPKTSSGKIRRSETRARFLSGRLNVVDHSPAAQPALATAQAPSDPHGLFDRRLLRSLPLTGLAPYLEAVLRSAIAAKVEQPLEAVQPDSALTGLGLTSIGIVQLQNTLEKELAVAVSVEDVFKGLTIRGLASALAEMLLARPETPAQAPAGVRPSELPLSHNQQQMWFLHQLDPARTDFNVPLLIECSPAFDEQALKTSLDNAVRRHTILRTSYAASETGSVQTVRDDATFDLVVVDARGCSDDALRERFRREAMRPFDLEKGPMLRAGYARVDEHRAWVLLCLHHIATDFWSLANLADEIIAECGGGAGGTMAATPPHDYRDWCLEKLAYLQSDAAARDRNHWKARLTSTPASSGLDMLPVQPSNGDPEAASQPGRINFKVPRDLLERAQQLAKRQGGTLNSVCLAVFQLLLHRMSRQEQLSVGTMAADRGNWRYERTQGYFVNPIVLTTQLRPQDSFGEFLRRSADNLTDGIAHQAYPFPLLVKEFAPPERTRQHPFFQAIFLMQQSQRDQGMAGFAIKGTSAQVVVGGTTVSAVPMDAVPTAFDLAMTLAVVDQQIEAMLEYDRRHVADASAQSLTRDYVELLQAVLAAPDQPATPAGRPLPDRRCESAAASQPSSLHQCRSLVEGFDLQVRRVPDRIAVTYGDTSLTYRQLNERAGRLSRKLIERHGAGNSTPIAILLHRSHEMVVSILAVLKAGASYLPLDPYSPRERLAAILEDAKPRVLLTSADFIESLGALSPVTPPELLRIDEIDERPAGPDGAAPTPAPPQAQERAYIVFTSGSTGRPKGVQVTHHNVLRLFTCCEAQFGFDENDVWTLFHSFAFDFSVWEMWGALLYGGRLVVVPYDVTRAPADFHDLLEREQVTVLNQTPSAFAHLARIDAMRPHRLTSLRTVVFGGEALVFSHLAGWFDMYGDAKPRLVNMYGITETTVHVTYRPVVKADLHASGSLIGTPLPDLSIELLDDRLRPVRPGEVGEIFVGGAGVSMGYLGNAALTNERFVELELVPGSIQRYYRSGDLARKTSTGDYEFHGRCDHQVNINGFRVELREIEAAFARFPGIRDCRVMANVQPPERNRIVSELPSHAGNLSEIRQLLRSHGDGRAAAQPAPRLSAYVVCDTLPDMQPLHRHLSDHLPDYMMPSMVIPVASIPLNHNGKVDARALEENARNAVPLRAAYQAPRTEAEKVLARLFAEVLDKPRVGVNDGFFELGGDSIRIIQLRSRALKAGLSVSVQDIFRLQTPAALAAATNGAVQAPERVRQQPFAQIGNDERGRLPADVVDAYPLARLQEGLLFHSLYGGDVAMYCDIFEFRLKAPYDEPAFRAAVQALIDRHPIFRTSFHFADFDRPLQLVHAAVPAKLDAFDHRLLGEAEREQRYQAWLEAEKRTPYAVARAPLLRFSLHRMRDDEFVFTMSFHDALLDGWSESSTVSELLGNYFQLLGLGSLPEAPVIQTRFSDFVALEQEALNDAQVRQFWESELEDLRPTKLPDWKGGTTHGHRMIFHAADLAPELSDELKALARQLGVSLKHVLLAAHAAVVSFVCGEADVVLAVESNGRLEDGDGERVLGTHLNVVPWRLQLAEHSWEELIRLVHDKETDLQPYRRFPYQEIQSLKGNVPLFDISFNYTHFHVYEELEQLPELNILDAKAYIQTHFALRVEFNQDPFTKHLTLDIEANVEAVPVEQVQAIGRYFTRALEVIAKSPSASFTATSLLGKSELDAELAAAGGHVSVSETRQPTLYLERFDERASAHKDRIAAIDGRRNISYGELARQSKLAALNLQRRGVGRGDVVALLADRSIEYLAAILGAWRLGAAFVPLPDGPVERINRILARAGASHVLHARSREAVQRALDPSVRRVELDALWSADAQADAFASCALRPQDLAYMIFTSGSTGEPKGVMIEHGGMINHMEAKIEDLAIGFDDKVSQDAAATFDICVWQFCAPLLAGAQVRVFEDDVAKDPSRLLEHVVAEQVTILEVSPSVLSTMLVVQAAQTGVTQGALSVSALRWIVSSGETLQPSLVHQLREAHPQVGILNMWGATETSDDCTHYKVPFVQVQDEDKISIGRPIQNAAVYVLDAWQRIVPTGTPGELYVGGLCVGRGYVNDPERTAAAYLPSPWTFATSGRLYRSGDRGFRQADGELFFIGRRDQQVKIRGHRIEIGEVEAALNRQTVVQEAAVLALPEATGELSLAAWIVPSDVQCTGPGTVQGEWISALRKLLKQSLPGYMVPDTIVLTDQLPKNGNGKVDRKALVVPDTPQQPGQGELALAQNAVQECVLGLFCQVLKRPFLSTDTSFFDAGGNSLLATQLISRAKRQFQVDLSIRSLFEHDTVIGFSRFVEHAAGAGKRESDITASQPRPERIPLSFNQERLWFLDRFEGAQRAYGSHFALKVAGALDLGALGWALQRIVDRHEILRTRFVTEDEQPHQVIEAAMELPLALRDLSGLEETACDNALAEDIGLQLQQPFTLDALPLCTATLYRLTSDKHVLLWRNHHIVGDGWSAGVMMREIERLYAARAGGAQAALPDLPIQFADYAIWQRAYVQSERFERQVDFWKGYLAGHSGTLDLPTDFERPRQLSFDGKRLAVEIPAALTEEIRRLCAESNSTLFTFLQCALGLLMSRYCKENDLLMGTVVANRQRIETEPLVGFLTNTLPVRLRYDPSCSFVEHMTKVRGDLLDVFENQDVPFEHLVQLMLKGRSANVSPLVQVMFVLQNEDLAMPRIEGLQIESLSVDRSASILDLLFDLQEVDGRITGSVEYNVNLFEERTIRRLWQHLLNLVEAIVAGRQLPISQLSTLDENERRTLDSLWHALQRGRSSIQFWNALAPQTPHWDEYLEMAEDKGILMSAYMAVSEYG